MRIRKEDLGNLIPLGEGGFSKVFQVPDYRLPGDRSELVYKEFTVELAQQGRSADAVVSFRETLNPATRAEIDRYTVWPRALVEDGGIVTGLLMPLIPDEFSSTVNDPDTGGTTSCLREMQWLIASKQQRRHAGIDLPDVDLPDRLALLARLAYILARLHEHGWVFGDLSFKNAVFALGPPRIMLLDCDGAAALTDSSRRQASTPFWAPPELSAEGSPRQSGSARYVRQDTFTDVYKLGLAILRCLSPGRGAATTHSAARIAGALDAEGVNLISRAVSEDRSSRPTARELYAYLYGAVPDPLKAELPPVAALRAWVRPLAGVHSDVPSAEDLLSTASDANTLAELIGATETAAPLAVALIGDWGSGKSSVMLQIQRRIDVLAEMSRGDPRQSMFAANVSQVRFNAWDYSDNHVWAGITEHLFRALSADTGIPDGSAGPEAAQAERARLRVLLSDREAEDQRLAGELRAADEAATPSGYLAALSSPAWAVRVIAAAVAELKRDIRGSGTILLGWIVLGAAAAYAWLLWGPLIGATASALAALLSPAVAVGHRLRDWHRAGAQFVDGQRGRLDARQRQLRQEIAQVKQRLAVADAAARLSAFLADRADNGTYRQHRGVLGQVRGDLAQLSADLAEARRQWVADGAIGQPPLERLVLYIDDLDRCPPQKVVEVLEAIHLMLALDLFIVVVAVDARWLVRSLEYHYRELFSHSAVPGGEDMASPADYLDKIFQIPFALNSPSPETLASYLSSLLRPPVTQGGQSPDSPAISDDHPAAADNSRDPASLPPAGRVQTRDEGDSEAAASSPRSPSSPSGLAVPDLRPLGLQLLSHEVEFMMRLSAILPTPRAAKKLTNLYRLIRIGVPDVQLPEFAGTSSGGPFQVVQILLAMLVSDPDSAHDIFMRIMSAPSDSDVIGSFDAVQEDSGKPVRATRLARQVAVLIKQLRAPLGVREYQRWCPVIARYSFRARAFELAPAPAQRDFQPPPYLAHLDISSAPSGQGENASESSRPVLPLYLACDVAMTEDRLRAVNEVIRHLRRDIVNSQALDDGVRMCTISFADRAEIGTSMSPVGKPFTPLCASGSAEVRYGPAFRLLAQSVKKDIERFRLNNYRVWPPLIFFITASAPEDHDWTDVYKEAMLPSGHEPGWPEGLPIFVPIGIFDAPGLVLRQLADLSGSNERHDLKGDVVGLRAVILERVNRATE